MLRLTLILFLLLIITLWPMQCYAQNRTIDSLRKQNMNPKLDILLSNFEKEEKKIVLKTAETLHVVHVKDIIRCEADGNYTMFYFANGNKLLISKSLKEYDELLSEYGFFRAHSAHLINLQHLERCDRTKGGMAYMKDKSSVPVALSRKQQLLEVMQKI